MTQPMNEAQWTRAKILGALKRARDKERAAERPEDRAVLTVNGIEIKPETPWPTPKRAPGRPGKFQKPRLTRYEFQARLDGREDIWRQASGRKPGVETNGRYFTWTGPSKIERGKKAVYLQAGNNIVEGPNWGVLAMRLGIA